MGDDEEEEATGEPNWYWQRKGWKSEECQSRLPDDSIDLR